MRLTKLFFQDPDIRVAQTHDRLIANNIHILGGRVQENGLFGLTQASLRGEHTCLGGIDLIGSTIAIIEILGDRQR